MTRLLGLALVISLSAACGGDGSVDGTDHDGGNPPTEDGAVPTDGAQRGTDAEQSQDGAVPSNAGVSLAVAHNTSCALRGDTVYCWGSNDNGQFGDGMRDMEPLATHPHATPVATDYVGARAVVLSRWASYVVTADHELWASGLNNHGQLPFETKSPKRVENIPDVAMAVGTYRVGCFVTRGGGELRCAGQNEFGEVGDGSGDDQAGFVSTGLSKVTSLSGGFESLCAVSKGDVYCWGHNDKGQVGNGAGGDGVIQATPVKVSLPSEAKTVATGEKHACALLSNGNVYCWGINWGHQAGTSSDSSKCGVHDCVRAPQQIGGITDAVAMAASSAATCAVRSGGTVTCWGDAGLTLGASSLSHVTGVASGHEASHFCVTIAQDDAPDAVACWGSDDEQGKLGRGTVVTDGAMQRMPALVTFPE